jgi:TctA family transporter
VPSSLGLFVRILRVRPAILAPTTVLITLIGAYTVNNSVFDIALVVALLPAIQAVLARRRTPAETRPEQELA